jgi:hypothetical protein
MLSFGNLCAYMQELVNKIFGKSGRIGRNYDEPAILNMFPKLALVAVGTHLSLLANVPLLLHLLFTRRDLSQVEQNWLILTTELFLVLQNIHREKRTSSDG